MKVFSDFAREPDFLQRNPNKNSKSQPETIRLGESDILVSLPDLFIVTPFTGKIAKQGLPILHQRYHQHPSMLQKNKIIRACLKIQPDLTIEIELLI